MYTLSLKQTNIKENVFFGDNPNNRTALRKFFNLLYRRNKHLFVGEYYTTSLREIDKDGYFVAHNVIGYFNTEQDAREYFNIFNNARKEIRILSREWNQQRRILSTAEIVSCYNTNYRITVLDCLQKVCERFGGKCHESGCSTVHFVEQFKHQIENKELVGLVGIEPTLNRL